MSRRLPYQLAGQFEGVAVFESTLLGSGPGSAGLALPGIGIFVGRNVFHHPEAQYVLMHEFGHILQARRVGMIRFYLLIGLLSLCSATTRGFGTGHQNFWTEKWANQLAKTYFNHDPWPDHNFPPGTPGRFWRYFLQ